MPAPSAAVIPRRTRLPYALAALAALLLVCIGASTLFFVAQPTSFRIVRSRRISAPLPTVRAAIVDLREMMAWHSLLAHGSGATTVTFSTPSSGPGAWMLAVSPAERVRITITSATDTRVEMRNEVGSAHPSTQIFDLAPSTGSTRVTWAMSNDIQGLGRALWPFVGLEGRLGRDMEGALERLEHHVTHR